MNETLKKNKSIYKIINNIMFQMSMIWSNEDKILTKNILFICILLKGSSVVIAKKVICSLSPQDPLYSHYWTIDFLCKTSFTQVNRPSHFALKVRSCSSCSYSFCGHQISCTSGLSNLNQPRAAHCKSCLKVGHLKQNLGGFIDFLKNFQLYSQS